MTARTIDANILKPSSPADRAAIISSALEVTIDAINDHANHIDGFVFSGLPWLNVGDYMTSVSGVPNDTTLAANVLGLTAAITALKAAGGGTLFFPRGRWPVKKTVGENYCLHMLDVSRVRLLGEPDSVLAVAGDLGADDTNLIQLTNCSNIVFEGMTFSQRDCLNVNEQCHMVQPGGSGALAAANDDIKFVRCRFIEGAPHGGDGVRILGGSSPAQKQTNITFSQCRFDGCWRAGIGVQRGSWTIHVSDCWFGNIKGSSQGIHFEPSGIVDTGQWRIVHNHFEACGLALVGTAQNLTDKYSLLADNTFVDGGVFCRHINGAIIRNNHIICDSVLVTDCNLQFYDTCNDVTVTGNFIWRGPNCSVQPAVAIDPHGGRTSNRMHIIGNVIHQFGNQSMIHSDSMSRLTVIDNRLIFHGTATTISGIELSGTAGAPDVHMDGNYCESELQADGLTPAGTLLSITSISERSGGVGQISCINNRGKRVVVAVRDVNANSMHTNGLPVISGNTFDATATGTVGGSGNALTAWMIAGAGGAIGVGLMTGTINPEAAVTAKQGTLYLRQNGDSSAIYLKQTGTAATGWVAVTVP
jgi:hypothetical protein